MPNATLWIVIDLWCFLFLFCCCCSCCCFVLFSSPPRQFFRLTPVRKSSKKMFPFKVPIILEFFFTETSGSCKTINNKKTTEISSCQNSDVHSWTCQKESPNSRRYASCSTESTNTGKSSFIFSASKISETVLVNLNCKIHVQSKTRWNLVSFKRK